MGTFRYILAVVVLLSHAGLLIKGHNPGVSAVISFFLLSGFVMTALIRKSYQTRGRVPAFYVDRIMRLYPQFLLYCALALLLVKTWPVQSSYLTELDGFKVLLNVLMIPLDFYMVGDIEHGMLIPQAWSLGLEATFYLVIPWLVIYRMRAAAFAVSVCVFMLAYFGVIHTQYWGYRLLPGTLLFFLVGSLMQDSESPRQRVLLWAIFVATIGLLLAVALRPGLVLHFNWEVLIGLAIAMPVVWITTQMRSTSLDRWLGDISYGVFLNHWLLIWIAEYNGIPLNETRTRVALVAVSSILALLSFVIVERPVIRVRQRLRTPATAPKAVGHGQLENQT